MADMSYIENLPNGIKGILDLNDPRVVYYGADRLWKDSELPELQVRIEKAKLIKPRIEPGYYIIPATGSWVGYWDGEKLFATSGWVRYNLETRNAEICNFNPQSTFCVSGSL